MNTETARVLLDSWRATCRLVASSPASFAGRNKEGNVFIEFRNQINQAAQNLGGAGPDLQVKSGAWFIDMVWHRGSERVAVEGKYKVLRDGAVPDNRKAAFFDLFKLEQCVDSRSYTSGVFLWLTDQPMYRLQASGDSAEFSTHEGRVYVGGTAVQSTRSRNLKMPVPLMLKRGFVFNWEPVAPGGRHSLVLQVDATHPNPALHPTDAVPS